MEDKYKQLIGSWADAIGTIISALAEVRESAGRNEINNRLIMVGEGLQAAGTAIIGTTPITDPLDFFGNWTNSAGAATSSTAAYLQGIDPENGDEGLRLEILGDSLQSLGASASAVASHMSGEERKAIGEGLQGLGTGLEAIGSALELRGEENTQILLVIGATLQAIGSNFNAIIITEEVFWGIEK